MHAYIFATTEPIHIRFNVDQHGKDASSARNLIPRSGVEHTLTGSSVTTYTPTITTAVKGEVYTVAVDYITHNNTRLRVLFPRTSTDPVALPPAPTRTTKHVSITVARATTTARLVINQLAALSTDTTTIYSVMLVKGEVAPSMWVAAPEDVQGEVDGLARGFGFNTQAELSAYLAAPKKGPIFNYNAVTGVLTLSSLLVKEIAADKAFINDLTVSKLQTVRTEGTKLGIDIVSDKINIFDNDGKVVAALTGDPLPLIDEFNKLGSSDSTAIAVLDRSTSGNVLHSAQRFSGIGAGSMIRVVTTLSASAAYGSTIPNSSYLAGWASVDLVLMRRADPWSAWVEYKTLASCGGRNTVSVDCHTTVEHSGDYALQYNCSLTPNGRGQASYVSATAAQFSYNYLDSSNMMSWYCGNGFGLRGNKDNYVHISFLNKMMSMVVKGNFDAPNIALVGYNISHLGDINAESKFGAKCRGARATYEGGGIFNVPHSIGHKHYNPIVALENSLGTWTPVERGVDYVKIKLADLSGNPVSRAFSITIFGKN